VVTKLRRGWQQIRNASDSTWRTKKKKRKAIDILRIRYTKTNSITQSFSDRLHFIFCSLLPPRHSPLLVSKQLWIFEAWQIRADVFWRLFWNASFMKIKSCNEGWPKYFIHFSLLKDQNILVDLKWICCINDLMTWLHLFFVSLYQPSNPAYNSVFAWHLHYVNLPFANTLC